MSMISGIGTRVILLKDGTLFIMTSDQEYKLKEGERDVKYFRNLDIHIAMDDVVCANAEMLISAPSVSFIVKEGDYKLYAELPENLYKEKRIESIIFRDGSVWVDKEDQRMKDGISLAQKMEVIVVEATNKGFSSVKSALKRCMRRAGRGIR